MRRITTLKTQQVLFFCDAMDPGTCRHSKNGCVSRTTQKIQLSLSISHKLRNLLLQLTAITITTHWTFTCKVVGPVFKILHSL